MTAFNAEHVVDRIYEAVSDGDRWPDALEAAGRLLDADAMLLLYCDVATGVPQVIASIGLDGKTASGLDVGRLDDDELLRESMNVSVGTVVSRTFSMENPTTRTTIMSRNAARRGQAQVAGAAAVRGAEIYASLWMARFENRPPFSNRDLNLFGDLLPHVARAMTVHHRIARAELEANMATGAIDRVAVGMVLLDASGRVVIANREARRIFDLGDGIGVAGRQLVAADGSQTAKLRRLVRDVGDLGAGAADTEPPGGAAIRIGRRDRDTDYHLVVLPLPRRCQPRDAAGAVAVLFITDPKRGHGPVDYLCGDLYGLTTAETRLLSILLEGYGLTAAADRLGLSRNTVHSQLASVFQKTGTRSQSELLRLILGGIAPIKEPDVESGYTLPYREPRHPND